MSDGIIKRSSIMCNNKTPPAHKSPNAAISIIQRICHPNAAIKGYSNSIIQQDAQKAEDLEMEHARVQHLKEMVDMEEEYTEQMAQKQKAIKE